MDMFKAESIYTKALNEQTIFSQKLHIVQSEGSLPRGLIEKDTWNRVTAILDGLHKIYGINVFSMKYDEIRRHIKAEATQKCSTSSCHLYITLSIPVKFDHNKSSYIYDGTYEVIRVPQYKENHTRILDNHTPQRIQTQKDLISYINKQEKPKIISFHRHSNCIANILENNIATIIENCNFRLFPKTQRPPEISLVHITEDTYYLTSKANITQLCSNNYKMQHIEFPTLIELQNECCSYQVNNQVIKQRNVCNINNTVLNPNIVEIHNLPTDNDLLFKTFFSDNETEANYSNVMTQTSKEITNIIEEAKESGILLSDLANRIQSGYTIENGWVSFSREILSIINTIAIILIILVIIRILTHIYYITAVVQHAMARTPIVMNKLI